MKNLSSSNPSTTRGNPSETSTPRKNMPGERKSSGWGKEEKTRQR